MLVITTLGFMILIDPPTWPAHGTEFSHLVSNSSYAELHHFARANHLSERAFDLDHYDVPAHLYDALIDAGAQPVSSAELTRELIASGLRVPLKERPAKIRNTLLKRWDHTLAGAQDLAEHILDQWEQPHRSYHNSVHLLEMLTALDTLFAPAAPPLTVLLATWFHDVVYTGTPQQDERDSAEFARSVLAPLAAQGLITSEMIDDIAALILLTITHEPSAQDWHTITSYDAEIFLDADMAILGASAPRYQRYAHAVRAEYSHFSDEEFSQGRRGVLQDFLERGEQLFRTEVARRRFLQQAQRNMTRELQSLREQN